MGCGHFVTGHFVTTISSHRHIVTRTFRHTDISSPDKTSHGHFVTGQNVTRTYRHMTFRHRTFRHNHFVTQTYRHTDISSHGHFVTGQNVTRTFRHRTKRHTDISSQDISSQRLFVTRTFCHRSFGYVLYLQPKFGVLLPHPIRQSKIFRPKIKKLLRNFEGSMIRRFLKKKPKCSRKSWEDLEYSFFGVRTLTHRSVAHRTDAD